MIYAENTNGLNEIMSAIQKAGVLQKYIDIGFEFLDSGDTELIKNIRPTTITKPNIKGVFYEFEGKFDKLINYKKNPVLYKRFAQFAYAVCGTNIWKIFRTSLVYYKANQAEEKKIFSEAIGEYTGKNPDALMLAIETDKNLYSGYRFSNGNEVKLNSAKLCLEAAEISTMDEYARVCLCAKALDDSEVFDDTVKKCIDIIKQHTQKNSHPQNPIFKFALAECAYFDDDSVEAFRKSMKSQPELLIEIAMENDLKLKRITNLILDKNVEITYSYINKLMTYKVARVSEHLRQLAIRCEDLYIEALKNVRNAVQAKQLLEVLQKANPEYMGNDLGMQDKARNQFIEFISNNAVCKSEVYDYIMGRKPLSEVIDALKNGYSLYSQNGNHGSYVDAYGAGEDIVKKAIVFAFVGNDSYYGYGYNIRNLTGADVDETEETQKAFAEILFSEGVPVEYILEKNVNVKSLVPYVDKILEVDPAKLNVDGRMCYLYVLSEASVNKYKQQIFAMADDSSKAIKEKLVDIIIKKSDWKPDIEEMLTAKKAGKRELALDIIERMKDVDFADAIKNAIEKEKSDKLKARMALLLGMEQEQAAEVVADDKMVDRLTKGTKAKKVEWLYKLPYKAVHFADGSEADEKYMKAILVCYASDDYATGKILADKLNNVDFAGFVAEVFGRFIDEGAVAKNKWVLVLAAIHGNNDMLMSLVSYIKIWSENMRGAMAVATVKALAMNGSQFALMQVDNMSRKYKSNQVKNAAKEALYEAADFLGITQEELADRIVPDFNFDEKMCRVFDYGTRKFSVYLTPSLEIEIYNGDKKIKNLPKPGANDTAEIAEKSYVEFKDMKKQLKNAITVQKARLEYTLMCERKWTAESWKKLFVKNPLMHCFAIGLIWGIYENDKLISTFRYLDDGSFTTADEDEFEIPENAQISLVHPVELSEDEISAWSEQLIDYEITQPFEQLSRTVYRPNADEIGKTEIMRFYGKEVTSHALTSKLEKNGWERGMAMDGGGFCEFYHYDENKKLKDAEGKPYYLGYIAELTFSGCYIGVYQYEAEDVEIEEVRFYKYNNINEKLKIEEVSPRYFSEIMLQLSAIV